jgi:hypothetical protein
MAGPAIVLRRINLRNPQQNIGVPDHDFNLNIALDQSIRCDCYQGRQSFLISPTRNSNGRRDYGNIGRNRADFSQRNLGTIPRNVEHGTNLLIAHYRAQERVDTAIRHYLQGNRLIHFNYRTTSHHWGPWADLEPPIFNQQWEANRIAGSRGDPRHSMLAREAIRRPWNRYRPVNYVADLPALMTRSNRQPPRWYHTNVEPRTGDNGEYDRLHSEWTNGHPKIAGYVWRPKSYMTTVIM